MFSEYDRVRILRLGDGDRWSEGSPSVGDIGTIVDTSGTGADTRYIVEHAPQDGTGWWVAEFAERELLPSTDGPTEISAATHDTQDDVSSESPTLDETRHRSKPSSDDAKKSTSKTPTELDPNAEEHAAPLISSAVAGALTSVLLVHLLGVSAGLPPLFVAGIAGAIGGFAVEAIVDSFIVAFILALVSVVVIYTVDSSLPREIILAFAAGLAVGKLVGSVVYEVSEFRHSSGRS